MPINPSPVLLLRSQINDERWNSVINHSVQSILYAYTWYLDIVCEEWRAIVWPSAENYQVIMPLPVKQKWGMKVVQQPLFCQYLGIFSISDLTDKCAADFLHLLDHHFPYISNYHFHPENYNVLNQVLHRFSKLERQTQRTFWLSLNQPHEQIAGNYTSDRKKNLKRDRTDGLTIFQSGEICSLITLFRQNHVKRISGGVSEEAFSMLSKLYERLCEKAETELWYAADDAMNRAGILIAKSGMYAIYLFNAADQGGRRSNARSFMLDQYFRKNAGKKIIFDFESPEVASIASFYKSFGGEEKAFVTITKNNLPFPFRLLQKWRKRYLRVQD